MTAKRNAAPRGNGNPNSIGVHDKDRQTLPHLQAAKPRYRKPDAVKEQKQVLYDADIADANDNAPTSQNAERAKP